MTVIDGIESEELKVRKNEIKYAILNNDKIENKLNVIMVISNPCEYKRRYILAKEFINRMLDSQDIELFIVETVYGKQEFQITNKDNKNHLQIRTYTAPIWHKESMISLGIQKLLPDQWKAVAWIDADIEFENYTWATDTLKILNGARDVVQLFSHCSDLDKNNYTMQTFHSLGYQYETKGKYFSSGVNLSHPGYCVAMTRKAYEKIGGVFIWSILGSGDHQMMQAFLGNHKSINNKCSDGYKAKVIELVNKSRNLRLGYTPGVICHYYHGSKANRKYTERWQILVKHQYDPNLHVTFEESGLLVPNKDCPVELLNDILSYFKERKEDE
jgi:hypothetical protein